MLTPKNGLRVAHFSRGLRVTTGPILKRLTTVFEEYQFTYFDSCLVFFDFDILSLIKEKNIFGFSVSF